MKTVVVSNKVLKLYDSIDEMPIINFQKYNKYLLIDSGVGSDADDIDKHIVKIAKFIKAADSKKALQELQNMRQNMHMVNNSISPKYLAFAALIHSINGREVTDLSDENLKAILADLKGVKHSWLISLLEKLKKKVESELEVYFPSNFANPREKEAYDKLKARALLILEQIITGESKEQEIEAIDKVMLSFYKPQSFIGETSAEVEYDKQFESSCILIAQKTSLDAKKMTVLQFYNAIENIKKQAEAEAKQHKPKRHGR